MKTIDIGAAIRFGWESIQKSFWYFVGLAFLYLILTSAPSYTVEDSNIVINILGWVLSAWLTAGFMKIGLEYYNGTKLPFATLFTTLKYFWRVLAATILIALLTIAGFILLVIPGIYLALRYQFTINFIVDKDMGVFEAMKQSSILTEGVKLRLFLFVLAGLGIFILGALALGVGIFVALPIIWLADIHIYKKLSEAKPTAPQQEESTPSPIVNP